MWLLTIGPNLAASTVQSTYVLGSFALYSYQTQSFGKAAAWIFIVNSHRDNFLFVEKKLYDGFS